MVIFPLSMGIALGSFAIYFLHTIRVFLPLTGQQWFYSKYARLPRKYSELSIFYQFLNAKIFLKKYSKLSIYRSSYRHYPKSGRPPDPGQRGSAHVYSLF
jgi:hypothetical protein